MARSGRTEGSKTWCDGGLYIERADYSIYTRAPASQTRNELSIRNLCDVEDHTEGANLDVIIGPLSVKLDVTKAPDVESVSRLSEAGSFPSSARGLRIFTPRAPDHRLFIAVT